MPTFFGRLGFFTVVGVLLGITHSPSFGAGPATVPTAPSDLHDRIVANYFAGKWDDVSADLVANIKEVAVLPAAQKANVDYIRKAIAECRPAWWKVTKAGATARFRPVVWGQTLNATFEMEDAKDPEHKQNIKINYANGVASAIVRWNAKLMDDPTAVGELPFTKGEGVDVSLWNTLGEAAGSANVPIHGNTKIDDQGWQKLGRYLDFRGSLATAYYTTPHARRLALWLAISGWSHEYDKLPNRIARRSLGILFAEEVVAHPEIYTAVPRPKKPEGDVFESNMVWELQEYIRNHDLSLSEEKSFREAVKAFATLNEFKVHATEKAVLPNGQAFSLDPAADKALEGQRDAWFKAQYAKTPAGAKP